MEKIENILYSVIPLVLIILFSWLFSYLGSRMRKEQEEPGAVTAKDRDYQLIDLMTDQKEAPRAAEAQSALADWPVAFPGTGQKSPMAQPTPGAPKINPRPIEPKWWGA
jgi:hypothetical protein